MGAGAATFLGVRARHPGFAMLALDNSVWLLADTYESGAGVYAVRDPARSAGVLRELEWLAREDVYKDPQFRRDVIDWLERRQRGWSAGPGHGRKGGPRRVRGRPGRVSGPSCLLGGRSR
ncbi:hypothetical protein [Streptomyces sp. NBC_00151]|jgi:hypothetical protein|uniref:hypothetical protein n=1 Tax=Streptomyces sp. NBC_00151 TaxID=2975669 RepID=UPI002DDA3252|nr:hypothetical protein [Streptomyces sp. NBC_00151]WRZ37480.1 hypothetical protein OG915_05130 [Streptomyces sp. NBC_00151]